MASSPSPSPSSKPTFTPTLILHGGSGAITRDTLPPPLYAAYRHSLLTYLHSTRQLLSRGTPALTAAVHAVSLMEDDPLFNCGKGSVFCSDGAIEMEASVMVSSVRPDGPRSGVQKRGAGVMLVRNVRHPIRLAEQVLLRTDREEGGGMHSQLSGPHVEKLAREWGLEMKPYEYFWTKRRWEEHLRGLKGDGDEVTVSQGTVGCVCLDQYGDLAVATSTGGLTNKAPGRIGDTPTLGAGFWAEGWGEERAVVGDEEFGIYGRIPQPLQARYPERRGVDEKERPQTASTSTNSPKKMKNIRRAVALSGTGNGDSFLRTSAVRTAAAMSRFSSKPFPLSSAVPAVAGPGGELQQSAGDRWQKTREGQGGIIGIEVDSENGKGEVVWDFNCGGMFRCWVDAETGEERMMVFKREYEEFD